MFLQLQAFVVSDLGYRGLGFWPLPCGGAHIGAEHLQALGRAWFMT